MKTISILVKHHQGPTGDVLIGKHGDTWCFPSGTVHTGEPEKEAAARVAAEKLGLQVKVGDLVMIGRKKPEDGSVEHLYCGNITHNTHSKENYHVYYEVVNLYQTEPKCCCCEELRYVHASELKDYAFAGDDASFMAKYAPYVTPAYIPDVRMY